MNIVIQASENERYEIQFDDYVMYTVRNESYTAWDDYEIRKGNYLVKFDRSRLLDYYGEVIIHTADYSWPHVKKHYGVYTETHIIDVLASQKSVIKKL